MDYLITKEQLEMLRRVASRLYTENRMDGDEMRDLAHTISAVINVCQQLELPNAERT